MDTPFQPFIDTSDMTGPPGVVPEEKLHPIIDKLVAAALNPLVISRMLIRVTAHTHVATGSDMPPTYALIEDETILDLGANMQEALLTLTRTLGTAMDEAVKRSKDIRIVELYKDLKVLPDTEDTRDALWDIMTREERTQAHPGRMMDELRIDDGEEHG
jgi:hypothetical protein